MQQEHKTVFISYRRKPAAFIARAIFQDLQAHGYDVFMDVENIDSGDFGAIIDSQIEARAHFLIILTTGTVGRFDEPKDWLRHEIEHAMVHSRNIVPLLINNFKYDKRTKQYLTGDLAGLMKLNSLRVPHDFFEEAMDKLRTRFLKQPFIGKLKPTPINAQEAVDRRIEETATQPKPTEQELSAEVYLNMGLALNDNSDEEIAYYAEAIRLNPKYAEAYINRGVARNARGDTLGAIADFDEAIHIKAHYADAYYNRGILLKALGNLDGAIADYNETIRLMPQDAKAYNNRGIAKYTQGNLNEAIADFGEAIRLNPLYIGAYNNRGIVRQAQNDLDGAIADFGEAIRLNPLYIEAYNNRGVVRQAQNDLNGAIADFSEALRLNPQLTQAHYNRGNARQVQNDLDGAITDYQKYLDLGGGKLHNNQIKVEQRIRTLKAKLK